MSLNQLLPHLDNAGRRLILSEILGQPKAYQMRKGKTRRRPEQIEAQEQTRVQNESSISQTPTPSQPAYSLPQPFSESLELKPKNTELNPITKSDETDP